MLGRGVVSLQKWNSSAELCPDRAFAFPDIIWGISTSDQCCFADAVAYPGLPLRPGEVNSEVPPHSLCASVDVVRVDLEAQDQWDLSGILPSKNNDVCFSLPADFSVIQEKCGTYSIKVPSNANNEFSLALASLSRRANSVSYCPLYMVYVITRRPAQIVYDGSSSS